MTWHRLRAGHYWSVGLLAAHLFGSWPTGLVLAEVSLNELGRWTWWLTARSRPPFVSSGVADTLRDAEAAVAAVLVGQLADPGPDDLELVLAVVE